MEKRWNLKHPPQNLVDSLQKALKIHPVLCQLLVSRQVTDFEGARNFFRPSLAHLHDPFAMKGMREAIGRLTSAIQSDEKILIYGDYDVDGTSSVACLVRFLQSIKANVDYYIPHRYREGYGVSGAGIQFAIEGSYGLIITVDCGIKSVDRVAEANEAGIDVIICDHHLPDEELPAAYAILNAKQIDCPYPFKELCGCGVAFKLIQGYCLTHNLSEDAWYPYLQFAAIAIAADIVPITGENRIMAFFGLLQINETPFTCIKALFELSGFQGQVHINTLVFVVAPRINAAGRMDDARKAVQLFLHDNIEEAMASAKLLQEDNTDRREADSITTEQALAMLSEQPSEAERFTTVLYQESWHKGVVGIVASRLIDSYYRPTVILTKSAGKITGSARSVQGFNLYEAIHACRHLLDNYGGHFYAAGLTMQPERFNAFKETFESVVAKSIQPEQRIPGIEIDALLRFSDIQQKFYAIICQMEPFGPGNMRPVFMTRHVYETGFSRIVKETHLKLSLKQDQIVMEGIGFGMAEKFSLLKPNIPLDIVFTLDINEWNGEQKLQLRMLDIKPSEDYAGD